MASALAQKRIALAEGRQIEELVRLLEKEEAVCQRYPMMSILDSPDAAAVADWTGQLIAGEFSLLILLPGEGLRRLHAAAERETPPRDAELVRALGRLPILIRGPKPLQVLRTFGLSAWKTAPMPTTAGVVDALKDEALSGKIVGVQLYSESNPALTEFLSGAGAIAACVSPYVYAPATDAGRVVELVESMATGRTDVLVFTSSPQIDRLLEVVREQKLEPRLAEGLAKTKVAAVGPVVADTLRGAGIRIDILPEVGFQMKNLVVHIRRSFETA